MNHSGDFVVYSYAIAGDPQTCTALTPANFVQVIPAIVNANSSTIRIVDNIQLQPPTVPHIQEPNIPSDSNASISGSEIDSLRTIRNDFANDVNIISLQIPGPLSEQTSPLEVDERSQKVQTKKVKLKQSNKIKQSPDLTHDTPSEAKLKVPGKGAKRGFIYECDNCDSRFLSATSLKLHKTGHVYSVPEDKKPWVCRFCGRHFSHQQTLGDHEKVHTDEFRYNCEACGAKYSSKSGLRNHLSKNEECDASFRNRKLLRKKEEESAKQYGCEVCGKKYRHRKSMVEHRSLHYKSKQHKCERCGVMFETTGGWRKHRANGRCEFSKSRFKDSNVDTGEESVFIPEDRKKFLEQVKQLETAWRSPDQENQLAEDVSQEISNENLAIADKNEESIEIKEESMSGNEYGDPDSNQISDEDTPKSNESLPEDVSETMDENPLEVLHVNESPEESQPKKDRQPKIHQCPTCKKIFARSFVLKNHMRTHTGERPFLCDTCSKSFTDMASLKGHLVIHSGEKPFACSECPARFARKSGLRNHITVHFNIPCDECDQKFPSRKTLLRHKIKHKGIRPFLCDVCSKDFQTKADMQAHMRIHSNEKRYACPICSARFNCPSTLRRHRNVHAPPETRPICESCGKSFSSQQALRKHENIHKNLKPFQCDVCAKCFRVNDHLRIHQRSHSGEKPFPCELCPKRFATNGDLRVHLRRHTGEKPYSCDECGEAFVVTAGLYRHQQQTGHRNNKPQAIIDPKVTRAT